MKKNS